MSQIKATITANSIDPRGNRITSYELVYPKIIHSELMTHRLFSRNSASSRAIPFAKMVKEVKENSFIPIAWQKDHKGMQGSEYFNKEDTSILKAKWLKSRNRAIESALDLAAGVFPLEEVFLFDENGELITLQNNVGVTKQLCNRLLEPFMWHKVLVTATHYDNFFELRCPQYHYDIDDTYFKTKEEWLKKYKRGCVGDESSKFTLNPEDWFNINKGQSEIHIMALAEAMYDVYSKNTPKLLAYNEWHIPYKRNDELLTLTLSEFYKNNIEIDPELLPVMIATAQAARVSYTTVGEESKEHNYIKDIQLHNSLLVNKHFSPFEHCARVMTEEEYLTFVKGKLEYEEIIEDEEYPTTVFYKGQDASCESLGWCNNFKGFIQYRYLVNV